MTLLDLCKLLKKNSLIVVGIPIACALACLGILWMLPPTYAAKATLVSTGDTSLLAGTATSIASQKTAQTGFDVQATTGANKTVDVTVRGGDAQACVTIANDTALQIKEKTLENLAEASEADSIAEEVKAAASELLANEEGAGDDAALYALALLTADDTTISITEATAATNASPIKAEYAIIAGLAGLLAALAIVIIKDMARGSVHNAYEVEENYDLRMLGNVRASAKRRNGTAAEDAALLAALDFASDDAQAICLIPMESAESAQCIVGTLEATAEAAGKRLACVGENADLTLSDPAALAQAITAQTPPDASLTFVLAPPVAKSADFAYLAPACGCAVLVVEAMRTKRTHFETALRQLALSATPVAGFILVDVA